MEETKKNSLIARLLAFLALGGTAVILIMVISGATGGGDKDPASKGKVQEHKVKAKPKTNAKTYEVESGDNLTTIAQKTGIPVDRLEKLNPDLDPQALQLGQEIKLR